MNKNERRTEAQRIADANGGTLAYINDEADFFQVRHLVGTLVDGIEADSDGVTNFEWDAESQRFEGFVSMTSY